MDTRNVFAIFTSWSRSTPFEALMVIHDRMEQTSQE